MKNETFMQIAHIVSQESKCKRAKVGAVLVKDKRIIATGYNGQPAGTSNCCEEDNKTKESTIHAEINAILNATTSDLKGCTMYVTLAPCVKCSAYIIQKSISTVYYAEEYHTSGIEYLLDNNVKVENLNLIHFQKSQTQKQNSMNKLSSSPKLLVLLSIMNTILMSCFIIYCMYSFDYILHSLSKLLVIQLKYIVVTCITIFSINSSIISYHLYKSFTKDNKY